MTADRFDALFEGPDWSKEPGCAAFLMEGDRTVWSGWFGLAHLGERRPIDADTRFRICSITKPMSALVIASLEDEGLLSLDDPLDRHLPQSRVPRQPTLRQLLAMKSGLYEVDVLAALAQGMDRRSTGLDALIALQLAQTGQAFAPGARTLYCNANYELLQLVAERLTGEPFGALLRRRVFGPAGMATAVLAEGAGRLAGGAAGAYARDGEGFRWADPDANFGAAGAVIASLEDMRRFQLWMRGDPYGWKDRLAAPVAHADGSDSAYACGFGRQSISGRGMLGHSGGIDGWFCDWLFSPGDDAAAVVLGNRSDHNWIERTRELLTLHLGLPPDPAMTPRLAAPEAPAPRWTQLYACEEAGISLSLQGADGELILSGRRLPRDGEGRYRRTLGVEPIDLEPLGDLAEPPATVRRREGNTVQLMVRADGSGAADPGSLIGTYRHPDLPNPLRVGFDGTALRLALGPDWPQASRRTLRPLAGSLWRSEDGEGAADDLHLRFEDGGLTAFSSRLPGLRFERAGPADLGWFETLEASPRLRPWSPLCD